MADESFAATHRTCVNPGAGGHTWGPYNPSPETENRRIVGGAYTRLHIM